MADRPFAYVCSPFRGDVERNTARAREYCRQVYEAGYTPLAPHLYFTQFLNDDYPKERVAGMEMGTALLPLCRVLLVCGNDITEGMKTEIGHAKRLGIEVCALENIPPIPTLENYRNDLTNHENIDIAVSLIEGMTGCRFTTGMGGVFIYPDNDAYLSVNMRSKYDHGAEAYRISFDANLRTMGHPMNSDGVLALQNETVRIQTLLNLLDSREFVLTSDEMEAWYNSLRDSQQQEQDAGAPVKDEEKPSVLQEIAAAREKNATANRPKREKQHKSHGEEL